MKFKELQSMLLENEYFITFQSMNSDKVYTKKCTLKETPNKVCLLYTSPGPRD